MKIFLSIIFSIVSTLATGQNDPLYGKWIAVFSRPIGDNWYSSIDGIVLDVNPNTVTIGYIFSDSTESFPFARKRNKIEVSNKFFGKIHFISKDSLVLDFDKRMRTRFIPIKNFDPKINSLNLTANSWTLKWSNDTDSINRRVDFLNDKWYPEGGPCIAITHEKVTRYKYQENEKWALKRIQGEWFLTLTQGQMDPIIYQVAESYEDSLKLICLSWRTNNEFSLYKNHEKKLFELDSIGLYLTQKNWRTAEVLDYSTSFGEDTSNMDEKYTTGYYARDTTLILKRDLLDKKISFNFNPDFTFQINVGNNLYWQTKWKISNDGSYVIINNGTRPEDYIEIISMENKQLVIGKADNFGTDRKREYFPYYYEIRLE